MKAKLLRITSILMMLLMLFMVTGCSKPSDQKDNEDAKVEEVTGDETGGEDQNVEDDQDKEGEEDQEDEPDKTEDNGLDGISTEGGIKDVYQQIDFVAGTCLSEPMINNKDFQDVINENFNSITFENDMKPDAILDHQASVSKGEIVVTFPSRTVKLLNWAKDNGMKVRGHTLIWYSQTPDWIFYEDFNSTKQVVDRETMLARMESFIKQTFEQIEELGFTDIFYAYDVVNEAILDDGSLRECHWLDIIGDDYLWYSFYYADKYAPDHVELYYNDFNEQFKTRAIMDMAKSLVDDDGEYLIDGIGCQGHLYTKDSIDQYINMLKSFKTLGLEVQITELDISLGTWQEILPATEENLLDQGQYYYELISTIVKENQKGNTNLSGITFWDFLIAYHGDG